MKNMFNLKDRLPAILTIAAILLLWEILTKTLQLPRYILPAPSNILAALTLNFELILSHTATTMLAVAGGLFFAVLAAALFAFFMDRWPFMKRALYPLLVISQAIPVFALAPLILVWFGVGLAPKILIVALVCFFPLVVNLVEGLAQVDPEEIELLKIMQANSTQVMRHVKLPATLPYFFSGLKIAATYSILGAIIGEWLGARSGLGIYMLRAKNSFLVSEVFASILVVIVLSLILFKIVELLAGLFMPWGKEKEVFAEEDKRW